MLENWLQQNKLNYTILSDRIFEISDVGKFFILYEKDLEFDDEKGKVSETRKVIFDQNFELIIDDFELINSTDCKYYCYWFGGKLYYIERDFKKFKFNILKYLGKAKQEIELDFSFLGVHGKYEILNGSRDYKDWIKKAKFLGIKNLGICEKNTLAGIMNFQLECLKKEVNPILGITLTVRQNSESFYDIKLYVEDQIGWDNLLSIYKELNIDNAHFIYEDRLLKLSKGLLCVICTKSFKFNKLLLEKYKKNFNNLYYQIDTVEFENPEIDKEYLENLNKFMVYDIKPVLISDAYYLDIDEAHIKGVFNSIASKMEHYSYNQYFKDLDDNFYILQELFDDNDKLFDIFEEAISCAEEIAEKCQFNVETNKRFLPKYKMNPNEKEMFANNEELFWNFVENGLSKCPEDKIDEYLKRIEYEYSVISSGDVIDYFLILADVTRFCKANNILVGAGRGSACGSLVSYVLDITQVDPIKWGLLFERFINPGRLFKEIKENVVNINGKVQYKANEKITVIRDGNKLNVLAKDILQGDEIL